MIKGVNKKIIEINNPNSSYFDKVILYLKPNNNIQSSNELSFEIDRYLKSLMKESISKKDKKNSSLGIVLGMAIILILVVTLLLI
ncbi:MAG: hypothetical protein LIO71_00950 [Ruminococcus sp.]|nr:hypothetical protein [Ruminococcus sp.]MCD7800455.1 hypothetical protein [Ruminococcus sp.]